MVIAYKEGDSHRAQLKREGETIYAPSRRGPHVATQAESDLQFLREAGYIGETNAEVRTACLRK